MRYRSYGRSDVAVSAITLELKDAPGKSRAADWRGVVFGALENGINAFDVHADASPGLLTGTGEALSALERRFSFVTLRCRVAPGDLKNGVTLRTAAEMAERLGLETFNCLMLEGEHLEELASADIDRLADLREISRHIGVGGGERIDALAKHSAIDAVATPYNLASSTRERSRLRAISETGAAVVTYDTFPDVAVEAPRAAPVRKLFGKPSHTPPGGYAFLHDTWGWTAEQICVAYLLTEPGLTSIRLACTDLKRIAKLAEAVDRDVPGGLGAQVEMARFSEPLTARRSA
jgi:hypothetical protein